MLILIFFLTVYGLEPNVVHADIPHLINYQGKLADSNGTPITGTKTITFKIYNVSSGGSPLWQETQSVTVNKGIFNVLLGSVNNLNLAFDVPYYLATQVGGDAEMTPRQRITSTGYAFRAQDANQAQNADTVDGINASATPEANKLLALNSSGKFPITSLGLKVYDSGWFYVTRGQTYTKTHNLGTTKMIVKMYYADDASGNNMEELNGAQRDDVANECFHTYGGYAKNITPSTFAIQSAEEYVHMRMDNRGDANCKTSGYYRIIAIALE